jgi:hypothetical protein
MAQPFEDAAACVALLGRGLLIVGENLLDDVVKVAKLARWRLADSRKRLRLRVGQNFADFASRMVERARNGANAHTIAMGLPNGCVCPP